MPENAERLPAAVRLDRIRELLRSEECVSIVQLAELFGVSEMTARRDLAKLEDEGQIKRTHGGAMAAERMIFEFDFRARRQTHRKEKRAIAREALKFVQPGHRIIIDNGTTTLELAHLLRDYENVTVVTPSLAVASELQFANGVETILLGGAIRRGSPDLTGALTEHGLDLFAVDTAFQGADALGIDGAVYNVDMRLAKVDKKMRSRAERTFFLADSSKIGTTALAQSGRVQDGDALITDDRIDPHVRQRLEHEGATVIITKVE